MSHLNRSVLLFLALALAARAQDSTTDTRARGISKDASSALSAGITYNPPKPEPEPEVLASDEPKNEIVRLPNYVVLGQKPAVFSDRNLHSRKELGKTAAGKFLSELDRNGLNKLTLPWASNEKRAMQMFYDAERQKNIQETKQHVALYQESGDTAKADTAQEEAYSTAYRPSSGGVQRDNGTWFGEQR